MLSDAPVPRNLFHTALGLAPLQPDIPASFPLRKFWHVVYTAMRREIEAKREIEELGFEVFLPMSSRKITKRGKRMIINDPLFTRYVFVAFDREKDEWGSINHARYVEYILGRGADQFGRRMPISVPEEFIERLKRLEENGAFDYTKRNLNFTEGDKVEIQEGPFVGLIAKVKCASPKKKVKLLLESLGRYTSIEIDPSAIVRV